MATDKKQRTEEVDLLFRGCVWLFLLASGAAIFLVSLFVGTWILS